jgi:ATP-dependent helicase/nuclease subunit A
MIFSIEADGRLLPGSGGLSDEQARALNLDRHVVVTAGAGSGKTRTLARRTLRILGSFAWRASTAAASASKDPIPGPEAILVSTFTERAAAEMKERIRAELVAGLRELKDRHADLEGAIGPLRFEAYERHLHRCLREFHRARIGTFHGFCASLLREFAAAAALDPGFAVLTGGDSKEVRAEVVEEALAGLDAGREDLLPLIQDTGRRATEAALMRWLDKEDELAAFVESLDGDVDAVVQRWTDTYGGDVDGLEAEASGLRGALAALAAFDAEGFILGEAAQAALAALDTSPTSLAERGDRLRVVYFGFTTQSGTLHKTLKGGGALSSGDKKAAGPIWKALRVALDEVFGPGGQALVAIPGTADPASVPVLRALATLGAEAGEAYRAAKTDRAALDFQDLQLRLSHLLRDRRDIAEHIAARYEHILVDEFQDTNALQWALVGQLLGDPRPECGLFLVGDPKQAIYRFRGGDVTMFDKARVTLSNVENVSFTTNYRSQPKLIDGFNSFFSWLMPDPKADHPPWEAPFEALTAARSGVGATELLWLEDGDEVDEARLIVERLPDLLSDHDPHGGLQVAILFRRRKNIGVFASALRLAGLPHVVARGRGFFSRQEVLDVADLLMSLAHADDGVALVGALRGPFLVLEDAWLLWLVRVGGRGPDALRRGWDRVVRGVHRPDLLPDQWAELPDVARSELLRAAADYVRWRELRRRLPLSSFLRVVLDDTAAAALFARQDPTGQVVANLEKLLSLAVAFDARGPEGLAEFGRHLRDQGELEVDEGEAALDATAPVVLMTIHQSKGLEFPVVILPDIGSTMTLTNTERAAVGRLGDGTLVGLNVETINGARERSSTMLRRLLHAQDRDEQRAESKRLLYVGATRARERLICVARPTKYTRGVDGATTWQEWLASWRAEADLPAGVIAVDDLCPAPIALGAASTGEPPDVATIARSLAPLPRRREPLLAPSALATGEVPADGARGVAGPAPSDPRALGLARGLLVHECIEDGLLHPGPATSARIETALASIGRLDDPHRQWMHQELALHLDGYRRADAPDGLREVPFQLQLGDGRWLRGAIDLLFRADDRWVVLDYKSDSRDESALVEHYRPQLVAYAWAVAQIVPEVRDGLLPVSAELLFTATGRRVEVLPPMDRQSLQDALQAALPAPHGGPPPVP